MPTLAEHFHLIALTVRSAAAIKSRVVIARLIHPVTLCIANGHKLYMLVQSSISCWYHG